MICAKNKEALSYLGIHPNLDRALESIKPDFLESLQDGVRVELDGDRVYCTRFTYETIPLEEGFFEAHRRYLDIHLMLQGEERVDVAHPDGLTLTESREDGDFYAYQGKEDHSVVLAPGTSWWSSRETPTASSSRQTGPGPSLKPFSRSSSTDEGFAPGPARRKN